MQNLTRREALMLAGTAAALMPAAAIAAIPTVAGNDAELLTLEAQLRTAREELAAADREWNAARDTVPDELAEGWPPIDDSMPHRPKGLMFRGDRISLDDLKKFNRQTEAWAGRSTPEYWRRKAEGRERIRWWVAKRREQLAAKEAAGLPELERRMDEVLNRVNTLSGRIGVVPSSTMAGAAVKLRELLYEMDMDNDGRDYWERPYLQSALDALTWLEARNV